MLVEHACDALVPESGALNRPTIGKLLLTVRDQREWLATFDFFA